MVSPFMDILFDNAVNRASVCPDAPLLGHDANPITHAPSFLKKNCSSTYSYPLVRLYIALIRSPAASEVHCLAAGLAGHGTRPPSSSGTRLPALPGVARCRPLQVVWPQPPSCSCGQCHPSASCSHCRGPPPTSAAAHCLR
jgi:hypothetical protein